MYAGNDSSFPYSWAAPSQIGSLIARGVRANPFDDASLPCCIKATQRLIRAVSGLVLSG